MTRFDVAGETEYMAMRAALARYEREQDATRQGTWFPTYSGRRFWPESPRVGDFDIVDIAHALACTNRWNGHLRIPLSVAEHSLLVEDWVRRNVPGADRKLLLAALLHDMAEAYTGDIISPYKSQLASLKALETEMLQVAAHQFDFRWDDEARRIIKHGDLVMLATEAAQLLPIGCLNGNIAFWPDPEVDLSETMSWARAEQQFHERFEALKA